MNVYEIITNRIIDQLEQGEIAWKKSWDARTQAPRNLHSGKRYNGVNIFLLSSMSYQSPYWLTYRQAQTLGGVVRKGEKSTPVIFWSFTEKADEETSEIKKTAFLKYYSVFNVSQIDGLKDVPTIEANDSIEGAEEYDIAEEIVNNMPNAPATRHGFSRACYSPSADEVSMPDRKSFVGHSEYFSTLFHELGHSTGHNSRLGRLDNAKNVSFASSDYSREELVAEFTSAYLCAEAGISQGVIVNQTAYIQGWLKALKNDSKLLISAAGQAQKAADYILNRQPEFA